MNHYVQNNFNESAIAKESKGNKALVIVTMILVAFAIAACKHAVGP